MQLQPNKQYPHGGVVVETLMALNAGQHNKDEIIGLPLHPTQQQLDDGAWDLAAQEKAADELIAKTTDSKDKSKPGIRRWVPQVNRQALKLGDQMKQFDDMCRQVAKCVFPIEGVRSFITSIEERQVLNPDQLAHLKAKFAKAEVERKVFEAKRKKEEEVGMMGHHPAEVQFRMQEEKIAAQDKVIAELQRQVAQLVVSQQKK